MGEAYSKSFLMLQYMSGGRNGISMERICSGVCLTPIRTLATLPLSKTFGSNFSGEAAQCLPVNLWCECEQVVLEATVQLLNGSQR